jgi:hypothetical protein
VREHKNVRKRLLPTLTRSPTASSSIRFGIPDSSSTRALAPKQFSGFGEETSFVFGLSPVDPAGVGELAGDGLTPLPDVGARVPVDLEPLLPVPLLVLELP